MDKKWEEEWAFTQTKMNVYANCKEDVFRLKNLMLQVMNLYLTTPSEENYALVHKVFIGNYDHMIFDTVGEMRRMRRIVEVMDLEKTNHFSLFSEGMHNTDELMEKYMLTIFSIRRFELEPTEELVEEGLQFLLQNRISPVAISQIVAEELFVPCAEILENLAKVYRENDYLIESQFLQAILKEMKKDK